MDSLPERRRTTHDSTIHGFAFWRASFLDVSFCGGLRGANQKTNLRLGVPDKSRIQRNLREAVKDALRIQNRFVAEPVFAKTGKGHLKSEGVETLRKIKSSFAKKDFAAC
jgi:hypothetical protein